MKMQTQNSCPITIKRRQHESDRAWSISFLLLHSEKDGASQLLVAFLAIPKVRSCRLSTSWVRGREKSTKQLKAACPLSYPSRTFVVSHCVYPAIGSFIREQLILHCWCEPSHSPESSPCGLRARVRTGAMACHSARGPIQCTRAATSSLTRHFCKRPGEKTGRRRNGDAVASLGYSLARCMLFSNGADA